MRMLRDVIVQPNGDDEWIAISREAASVGETMLLDVFDPDDGELQRRFTVCVIESQPIIVDGDVRHRVRLYVGEPPVLLKRQSKR